MVQVVVTRSKWNVWKVLRGEHGTYKTPMYVCYSFNDYFTKTLGIFKGHHILTFALIRLYSFYWIYFIYNKRNEDTELFGIYFNWARSLSSRWLGIILCRRKLLELRLSGNLRTVVIDKREGRASNLVETLQLALISSDSLVVAKHTHKHTQIQGIQCFLTEPPNFPYCMHQFLFSFSWSLVHQLTWPSYYFILVLPRKINTWFSL